MEDAVNASTAGDSGEIVIAGAGYAGLHVALRLTAKLRDNPGVELTLVDRHDYHQVLTELPRVAGGTRAADAVRAVQFEKVILDYNKLEPRLKAAIRHAHDAEDPKA